MATRAVAISGSRSAAAADSSSQIAMKKTTKSYTYKTDASGNVSTEIHTHTDSSNDTNSVTMRRMEERIRIIQDDLESEQNLRRRIEKEKHSMQTQIIALSERLTEAEGGAENQLEINRRRETEMAKLRKLLEDVHTESEQSIHVMKKKHQEAMMELQEQIESVSRSKEAIVKQKSKMQTEISELLAHIEVLSSEKVSIRKVVEKMEIQINEYNIKVQDMNKSMVELNSQKNRLQQDNTETVRKLNEMKHSIDAAGLDKNKLVSQLKDFQDNMDNLNRAKVAAETKVRNLEQHVKSITIELEETKESRSDLEKFISKLKEESSDWKKRYENEARLRSEDVEALKKKYSVALVDLQDHYDAALTKLRTSEQQKVKLQQEIEILIKQFESSQVTIKEVHARLVSSEKKCDELAAKLREMTNMYERADRDSKARAQDLVKLSNEMDRCKMENDVLRRDKGKLEDDCGSFKAELNSLKHRLHEAEQENRKLCHDREELARAFKDADGGKQKAEIRVKELEDELKKLRVETEKYLNAKDNESLTIRKKLTQEIENLSARLLETEQRLKVEVEKIKKKMSVTITELEMSLDASNKNNVQLQNAGKQQATKFMELASAYEQVQQKLQQLTDLNDGHVKKLHASDSELVQTKRQLVQLVNDKRIFETKLNEFHSKITEITNINTSLSNVRAKLEKELVHVTSNYEDLARELKLADDRANKAAHDAQHFEALLREEQVKIQKVDNAKKALESEVRNLTIRMEEIETTAVTSSKRTIQKMEQRIEELETYLATEKKTHAETVSLYHKKERGVKELLLQSEEDRKNILILQESLDRLNEKIKMYKRQLEEQESISNSNIMRVRKFQRELEASEGRAEEAESCLNSFRSQQRVFAAAAESRRENVTNEVDSTISIRKTVTNVTNNGTAVTTSKSSTSQNASRDYRAGSTFSRAGSVTRASVGRASSMLRY